MTTGMTRPMIFRHIALSLLAIGLSVLTGAAGQARAEILVGAAAPLSGPNAALGTQLRRGVQMAVDDINATGGIRGERLAVTFADDGCDPRKAVDVATEFVAAGVKAVIGHYCSGASIPASKVYQKAGIMMISPASTNPKLTDEGGWNVIRLVPRDDAQAAAAADLVRAKFTSRKIAIVSDQSPAFAALAQRLRAELEATGMQPAALETYKAGTRDFDALVSRIIRAEAGVVYIAGTYVESGQIARALRARGSQAQFISGDGLVTEDFLNQAKEAADGTLMTFTYDPRNFATARPVIERMKAEEQNAEGFTLYAYAAVQALVAAAEGTGSLESARLAEWLRAGNRFDTVVGPVIFDMKGDLKEPRVSWFRWLGGRYVDVDPATLAPPLLDTTP
jgi:branched-chain amino acid transport system substrate-binding protein